MERSFYFETVTQYNDFNNHETRHPLVSVIDFSKAERRTGSKMYFGIYAVFLKEAVCGDLKYGCNTYDYQEGTLVFVSPGQVVDVANKTEPYQPAGYALAFHPDLLLGTALAKNLGHYSFFSYHTHEALHLSEQERRIVLDCLAKIELELKHSVDKHSKRLIASNIELFLNYCERFYDRQFITRENVNRGILERFEELINGYYSSGDALETGVPSVAWCAEALHLSPNYFGDLVKKETGRSAQEYIRNKVIEMAKKKIFDRNKTINEIAYELGFKYPQHFIRLFKQQVGRTPHEYRLLQ